MMRAMLISSDEENKSPKKRQKTQQAQIGSKSNGGSELALKYPFGTADLLAELNNPHLLNRKIEKTDENE